MAQLQTQTQTQAQVPMQGAATTAVFAGGRTRRKQTFADRLCGTGA